MVFQDFDQISERRRAERARKFRQRVIIGVISGCVILLVVAAAVFSLSSKSSTKDGGEGRNIRNSGDSENPKEEETKGETKQVSKRVEKMITMICNSTDYKGKCESTLKEGVEIEPDSSSDPKNLIKLAISAAVEEVKSAVKKAKGLKFGTEEEKGAFEDCQALLEEAVEELEMSVREIGKKNLGKLTGKTTPDLNNWLSAVMSYHETCVDGFPDGKIKSEIEKAIKAGKELTSNSLAMISQVATFFSTFDQMPEGAATRRRLLGVDGMPTWINTNEQRRMLKGAVAGDKPKPNVVVAKDGSGDFKTINQALAAMPPKYDGRYLPYPYPTYLPTYLPTLHAN